jgi:DNA-directed RNA polymerase subunit RPC12/RpoP
MNERNELVSAILVVEAESIVYHQTCARCNKVFIPNKNAKKGTASYYRCQDCLTTKVFLRDLYVSNCVIS